MPANLEKTKAIALGLLIGALVLLGLSTAGLEGHLLYLTPPARPAPAPRNAAVDQFGALFAVEPFVGLLKSDRRRDVFNTAHFQKPPAPPADPPKPRTRTVALTYLGVMSGTAGAPAAFVRVDDQVVRLAAGTAVIDQWMVASVDRSTLVLTNATGTNRLGFRQSLNLTVPVP